MEESGEPLEALRLKTLAERKYKASNLKSALKHAKRALSLCPDLDGGAELVTAFKILRAAAPKSTSSAVGGGVATPDWYKILQIEPFSHINIVKKQYKKLALALHPDKNPFTACEEAFKLVAEAFRVLSDKIRRKEYDMRLRIEIQSAVAAAATDGGGGGEAETFWTACSGCRLLHKFERKYLGHNLMCPNCKKSFEAVEVSVGEGDDRAGTTRVSERIRSKRERTVEARPKMKPKTSSVGDVVKPKMSSVGDVLERSRSVRVGSVRNVGTNRGLNFDGIAIIRGLRSKKVERAKIVGQKEEKSRAKKVKVGEDEMMTLAEMQMLVKKKVQEKRKLKENENEKESEKEKEKEKGREKESRGRHVASRRATLEVERSRGSKKGDLDIMAVEDSDFYDFDKERVEKLFKKGQVWAIYDDDDGMPRHYGLIDEVVSVNAFEVKMSWLDLQSNGDEGLICWEKMGFHISCGRFKVSRKTAIDSINVFSHLADCERAAREVYRIYPKKGSVWALYNDNALDKEGRNLPVRDKRCYDIVVFLTSYSELHGLSMAYLEKVDGFKTVFRRREIGCHAIRWLEKDDFRLFSHQIPARKLSGEEVPNLSKDCWELDPASLPPELLSITWEK